MSDSCVNCNDELGDETKVQPVILNDVDGSGEVRSQEMWCPQCFVFHRAPMEHVHKGGRFYPERLRAVRCGMCGWVTVDHGTGRCGVCPNRIERGLPPKPRTTSRKPEAVAPPPPALSVVTTSTAVPEATAK